MNDNDQLNIDMSNDFSFRGNGNPGNKIMRKKLQIESEDFERFEAIVSAYKESNGVIGKNESFDAHVVTISSPLGGSVVRN